MGLLNRKLFLCQPGGDVAGSWWGILNEDVCRIRWNGFLECGIPSARIGRDVAGVRADGASRHPEVGLASRETRTRFAPLLRTLSED